MNRPSRLLHALVPAMLALALALPVPAHAGQGTPVELTGYVKLEKTMIGPDGAVTTELIEPDVVVPGDRLVFGTRYRNSGELPVENFVVTTPLPAAVALAVDADPALLVSVDAGRSWGVLTELRVAQPDGTSRPATASDVGHIRSVIARIAPGESGSVEFPVKVR